MKNAPGEDAHAGDSLQERIKQVARDTTLSADDKTSRIQELYNDHRQRTLQSREEQDHQAPPAPCTHYRRDCEILAACCGSFFGCRLCHDEQCPDHEIDRFATKSMRCKHCRLVQPVAGHCGNEECVDFTSTRYFCRICNLWINDEEKHVYHCDDCGICRVGKRDDFFHCNECNLCLPNSLRNKHTCLRAASENNCPVCLEFMFSSTSGVVVLDCGHCIHQHCMGNLHACPTCKKSLVRSDSYEAWYASQISAHEMPDECAHWVSRVLCNDCLQTSNCPFHYYGHQCQGCRSFNTTLVTVDKSWNGVSGGERSTTGTGPSSIVDGGGRVSDLNNDTMEEEDTFAIGLADVMQATAERAARANVETAARVGDVARQENGGAFERVGVEQVNVGVGQVIVSGEVGDSGLISGDAARAAVQVEQNGSTRNLLVHPLASLLLGTSPSSGLLGGFSGGHTTGPSFTSVDVSSGSGDSQDADSSEATEDGNAQ